MMMSGRRKSTGIDIYIAEFPEKTQILLKQLRSIIGKTVPEAVEVMKYGIPTFTFNGNLVHFAAYKNHIGFYPAPSGIKAFQKELTIYKSAKGSVQFPLGKPLPIRLITKIVKFRAKENSIKAQGKIQPAAKSVKKGNYRTCANGHKYFKSSNCPTCPVCEQQRKPKGGFLMLLSAPARRALQNHKIVTLQKLSGFTEAEILNLHGIGKHSLPLLRNALKLNGLSFKMQ